MNVSRWANAPAQPLQTSGSIDSRQDEMPTPRTPLAGTRGFADDQQPTDVMDARLAAQAKAVAAGETTTQASLATDTERAMAQAFLQQAGQREIARPARQGTGGLRSLFGPPGASDR